MARRPPDLGPAGAWVEMNADRFARPDRTRCPAPPGKMCTQGLFYASRIRAPEGAAASPRPRPLRGSSREGGLGLAVWDGRGRPAVYPLVERRATAEYRRTRTTGEEFEPEGVLARAPGLTGQGRLGLDG